MKHELDAKQVERICDILRNADLNLISAETYEMKKLWNPEDVKSIDYKFQKNPRINLKSDYIPHRWGDIYQYTLTLSEDDNNCIGKYESMNGSIHGGANPSYIHLCLAYTFKNIAERITLPIREKSYRESEAAKEKNDQKNKQELEEIIKALI